MLFSLAAVGYACNLLGGAGGPLAVLFVAIIAAECGKAVSKETKIDILVTPIVTTLIGVGAAYIIAPPIGTAASAFGMVIMKATELQPFLMGILVSVLVGIAPDAAHLLRRHLLRSGADRSGRRRPLWQAAAPRWWASP